MDREITDLFNQEKENVLKKKIEREMPISERRAIKIEQEARKLLAEVPNNRKELTTEITRALLNTFVDNIKAELYEKPLNKSVRREIAGVYTVANADRCFIGENLEIVKKAVELCSPRKRKDLYIHNGLTTINREFFTKYGFGIKLVSRFREGTKDTLAVTFTLKQLNAFAKDILENNYKDLNLERDFLIDIKEKIVKYEKVREYLNDLLERMKKNNKEATLEICKEIIKGYKELPIDDTKDKLDVRIYLRKVNGSAFRNEDIPNVFEVLSYYHYANNFKCYGRYDKQILVYIPYLYKSLRELGVKKIFEPDDCTANIIMNISEFEEMVLGKPEENEKTK